MQKYLTSGQFAKACSTTKRTVHYYDEIGLIKPKHKSEKGYRLYDPYQVIIYKKIELLINFGFELEAIKEFIKSRFSIRDILKQQEEKLTKQIAILKINKDRILEYLSNFEKEQLIVKPKVKIVKPYSYLYMEVICDYEDINRQCLRLEEIMKENKIPYKNVFLTIFKEEDFHPVSTAMEIGVIVNKNVIKKYKIPEVLKFRTEKQYKALCYLHKGSFNFLSYIWKLVEKYFYKKGLTRSYKIHNREIYWMCCDYEKEKCKTEIQIMIK